MSSLPQNSIDNLQEMATSDFTVSIAIADSAAGSSVIPMWLMFASNFSRTDFNVLRVGVNYHFGGPVVAQY